MPGQRAHLTLWDAAPGSLDQATGLPDLAGGAPYPACAGLLVDGRVVTIRPACVWSLTGAGARPVLVLDRCWCLTPVTSRRHPVPGAGGPCVRSRLGGVIRTGGCGRSASVRMDLMTHRALVTGVGRLRGIGAGIAAGLADDGWDLVLSYWQPYDGRLGLEGGPDDPDQLAATSGHRPPRRAARGGSGGPAAPRRWSTRGRRAGPARRAGDVALRERRLRSARHHRRELRPALRGQRPRHLAADRGVRPPAAGQPAAASSP